MDWGIDGEDVFALILLGLVALALAFVSTALVKTTIADGRVDYCYVDYGNNGGIGPSVYYLHGHRPWRPDSNIKPAQTLDEAISAAKAMDCPLATINTKE